ncbi:hypothetical protein Syun_008048 [Stephania yunnanensis]|uniref:Stress response NST1-like protein n=1 Tax=Stephania yunnanensis TaxID=152371 RepID=A0AAP0PZ23_9MAGN
MNLQTSKNGENHNKEVELLPELQNLNNGGTETQHDMICEEDLDSTCSTPYVSAPSSPGHLSSNNNGYFFSAPASPMHFALSSAASPSSSSSALCDASVSGSFEFEFSSRFCSSGSNCNGSMSSADELFLNGQIRPMKLSSHLQRPQLLAPLLDLDVEDEDYEEERDLEFVKARGRDLRSRNRSLHRRARSMSPMRNPPFQWNDEEDEEHRSEERETRENTEISEQKDGEINEFSSAEEATPSVSASSSRSSSTGRSSRRWVFLKDFLRSKSEGRGNAKDKFWQTLSFSPSKDKKSSTNPKTEQNQTRKPKQTPSANHKSTTSSSKPANGVTKRRTRPPSPHEAHYTANRAQTEEMKKRTFLPYRQGLLGCLGFSSKGYGAMNGFARSLHPVSS